MNLHVFNPEHDIALAADNIFWTAPHAGRRLRADLGWLPSLWAEDGDYVLVDDVQAAQNAFRKLKVPVCDVRFVTLKQLSQLTDIHCVKPWGWDRSIVHQLEKYGVCRTLMPSDDTLDIQRRLSDRMTASRLLADMRRDLAGTCGESWCVTTMEMLSERLRSQGKAVLKAPWSSSGRGVRYVVDGIGDTNTLRWAEKILKTQGHIMVEAYLNKVKDFGMEFSALPDGSVRYDGLSLFSTVNGAYEGSVLCAESEKEECLTHFVEKSLVADVQKYITRWMKNEINGRYVGPFGVDMMIVSADDSGLLDDKTCLLNPCVEINLRRTMGHVALAISPAEREKQQVMRIGYDGSSYHMRIINDHEVFI